MSTLHVENLKGLTSGGNANKIIVPSGQELHAPGHVVQVVSSGAFTSTVTASSTSFTATGHSVSITTKTTNSNILVQLAGGGWYDNGNGSHAQWLTFYRSVSGGSYAALTGVDATYGLQRMSGDGGSWNIKPHSAQYLDATNQSSGTLITYQVYVRINSNSSQYNHSDRGTPVLTAMEIAQ